MSTRYRHPRDQIDQVDLAADADLLGSTVLLNDEAVTLVGVAEPNFEVLVAGCNRPSIAANESSESA